MNGLNLYKCAIILMLPVCYLTCMEYKPAALSEDSCFNPAVVKPNIISLIRSACDRILSIDRTKLIDVSPEFYDRLVAKTNHDLKIQEAALNALSDNSTMKYYEFIGEFLKNTSLLQKKYEAKIHAISQNILDQRMSNGVFDARRAKERFREEVLTDEYMQDNYRQDQLLIRTLLNLVSEQGLTEHAAQLKALVSRNAEFDQTYRIQMRNLNAEIVVMTLNSPFSAIEEKRDCYKSLGRQIVTEVESYRRKRFEANLKFAARGLDLSFISNMTDKLCANLCENALAQK